MSTLTEARAARDQLKRMPAEARRILADYRALRLRIMSHWDPAQRRQLADELKIAAVGDLARLKAEHRKLAEVYRAAVHKVRRSPANLGTTEQMAWERLRGHLDASKPGERLQRAQARLERAQRDDDRPMLTAARAMLPDWLATVPGDSPDELLDWLDVIAGDADTAEAVVLEREGRTGLAWTEQAVGWVEGEVQGTISSPVNIMPEWDGSTTAVGPAPDYAAQERATNGTAANVLASAGYRPTAGGGIARTGGRSGQSTGEPE